MKTQNKKGLTLVEVVVALGILAFVFAGVVTLIVNVVKLELSARDRTEAVALAQGKMAEVVVGLQDGCVFSGNVSQPKAAFPSNSRFKYTVTEDTSININDTYDFKQPNFSAITVTVEWRNRYGDNSYQLKQIAKKCQ